MEQLTRQQIESFINDGFVRTDNAFPETLARDCREILWKLTGCDPTDPESWKQPEIRIGERSDEAFQQAANTPILHKAFDQLVGEGNWLPRTSMGSFPIRFPVKAIAGDTGWHVDASFPGKDADDYLQWRINIQSKGRALLMLFLFSDVSDLDAPTIIKIGSHLDVAKLLEPEGENGLSFMELAQKLEALPSRELALATGKAGTVYLCHPFLAHAAQDHKGTMPKFMAQPPLLPRKEFNVYRPQSEFCPVEKAIVKGLRQ